MVQPDLLRSIGLIVSAHGLKGEVVVKPWDENAPWAQTIRRVFLLRNRNVSEMTIQSARFQGTSMILKLAQVNTRNDAEKLKGTELKVYESELPALAEDEFYVDSLAGLTVLSLDSQREMGTVREVLSSTAGDYLEVVADGLKEPILIPFQTVFVPKVDLEGRQIFITGLDSLFDA